MTIRMVAGTTDSYHFSTTDVVEVWDGASGLYILDLPAEKEWLIETSKPVPNEETVKFLQALTCCAFDEAQNIVTKSPISLPMGNWSQELLWDEFQKTELADGPEISEENELAEILETYREGPKEGQEDQWFANCDKVWADLCEKKISYTGSALESWFGLYYTQADDCGYIEQIETGIRAYLEILVELADSEEDWASNFDSYMIDLTSKTKVYDSLVAEKFQQLSDKIEQDLDSSEDFYYVIEYYTVCWLQSYGEMLSGNGIQAFGRFDKAKEDGILSGNMCIMADILRTLRENQVQEAVRLTMDYVDMGEEDEQMNSLLLKQEYVFMMRGLITEETLEEYLSVLPADIGMQVVEVSPESQKAGLQYGDLIVAVDGRHASCLAHFKALPKDNAVLEIMRNGERVFLEKDGTLPFGGRFRIIFREEE